MIALRCINFGTKFCDILSIVTVCLSEMFTPDRVARIDPKREYLPFIFCLSTPCSWLRRSVRFRHEAKANNNGEDAQDTAVQSEACWGWVEGCCGESEDSVVARKTLTRLKCDSDGKRLTHPRGMMCVHSRSQTRRLSRQNSRRRKPQSPCWSARNPTTLGT